MKVQGLKVIFNLSSKSIKNKEVIVGCFPFSSHQKNNNNKNKIKYWWKEIRKNYTSQIIIVQFSRIHKNRYSTSCIFLK